MAKARGFVLTDSATTPNVEIVIGTLADTGFVPSLLRYFGRGLSDGDTGALEKVEQAVLISVAAPADAVADTVHGGAAMARAGAGAVHGWIQDRVTSETFTLAAFDAHRPEGFPLDVQQLIVIHAVAGDGSSVFFETFGLIRFGLPELYMQGVPHTFADDTLELVEAAAQTLVERAGVARAGELVVDLAQLATGTWPAFGAAVAQTGGSGKIRFGAAWTLADRAGEPDARPLIELNLPGGPVAEQVHAALTRFFGKKPDTIIRAATDDAELEAARQRAQRELAGLAPHFAHGIPEGERLIVKAPFRTDDGDGDAEWMWIEVASWKRDLLTGVLINTPEHVAHVKVGARVEVRQAEIFDYLHNRADGTVAGGETNRILEQQEKRR